MISNLVIELRRQARLAEVRLFYGALLLVSAALSAVSLFGNRIEQTMQAQTSAILGADALLVSSRPINEEFDALAKNLGLDVARSISFLSMMGTAGGSRLVGVRAVSDNYPLRGEFVTRDMQGKQGPAKHSVPSQGEAWAASALLRELNLVRDTDVELGDSSFYLKREILLEPEGGAGMLRLAPRVMINLRDLAATGLVSPASRVRFRLLVAGESTALEAFADVVEARIKPHQSWHEADVRREEARSTTGRVQSYLRLVVLLSIILSIIAMALAAQGLWQRQTREVALLRCLGQTHARVFSGFVRIYLVASIPIGLAGCLAGWGFQYLAADMVTAVTGIDLPGSSLFPLLISLALIVAIALGVILPFLLVLRGVPAIVLLRSEQQDQLKAGSIASLSILLLIVGVTLLLARDILLAAAVLAGLVLAAVVLWVIVRLIISLIAGVLSPGAGAGYLAFKGLAVNAGRSAWLTSTFGITVFALVLLGAVRADMFNAWQNSLPEHAPNLFLVNIQDDDLPGLEQLLQKEGVNPTQFFPIVRGRLVAINGREVHEQDFDSEKARHRLEHEFNLTEEAALPVENELTGGRWFVPGESAFSVEQDTARMLGLDLGDSLTIDVAGSRVVAPITSLRSVRWDNMRPNFFIIGSPGVFTDIPRTYITSVYVSGDNGGFVNRVNGEFPGVTAIDLDMLLARVRGLITQAGTAVSLVFIFTLVAALLVLVGVLQGQRSARRLEVALLKALGAGSTRIRHVVALEFIFLGALAGFVGSFLALLSGWLLAIYVFEFDYLPSWGWLFYSTFIAGIVVGITGYASIRPLLSVPPVRLLAR